MTHELERNGLSDILERLGREGFGGMQEAMRMLLNEAMRLQRETYLGAGAYERTESRRGHANGFKNKTVQTRIGEITVQIPQTRDSGFYPSALEKGLRSERALCMALAEMYVQGVSTRKVSAITEKLCGTELTSMQVSRAAALLDESLAAWRNRPISGIKYLVLDARYEKVRSGGQVRDCAVLIALGVTETNHRTVLGVSVSLGEHEVHWREFLQSLVKRGLCGLQLIVSDAHAGLGDARSAVFGGVPWQRCQFHLQQNAQSYIPKQGLKKKIAAEIRQIFNSESEVQATEFLRLFVTRYEKTAPKLASWAETAIPEGFTIFRIPAEHQKKMRTSNLLERLNKEIKRRTRVATMFPNEASCLRLVSAILIEVSEEWETGRCYLRTIEKDE